jgi:hypothetical protein
VRRELTKTIGGRRWHGKPNAASNAIGYAKHRAANQMMQ